MASEQDPEFAAELPAFVDEIRRIFTTAEICAYLNHLERAKFLAPFDPDLDIEDPDDEIDEPCHENPVRGRQRTAPVFTCPTATSAIAWQHPSCMMARRRKDPIGEERIHNEAIIDAYGPEEQAMGWYYYLETRSISVPGKVHRRQADFAAAESRNGKSPLPRFRRHLQRRHACPHPMAGPQYGCSTLPGERPRSGRFNE
jgi:hypothetical protein